MNINPIVLLISVATLFCFMLPGYLIRKTRLADNNFAKSLSLYVLYIAQVAMIVHGFLIEFESSVFLGVFKTLILAFLAHAIFYVVARRLFKKAPESKRRVLQFGIVFSNAGYMGIPVISDVFGEEYAIYATAYVVAFNVFVYSLGRLIYTDDKKYISVKKIFINPAVLAIMVGLVLYITGVGGFVQSNADGKGLLAGIVTIIYNVITILKNTVAPVSMMVIGASLADIKLKGAFKDKRLYPFLLLRHFIFPLIIWLIMRPLLAFNVINDVIMAIVLILSSTPSATATTMFAELYGCDSPYASKLVSISTILSVVTMPLVAMLMYI